MEPGLYYHQAIRADFELADAAANVAEKEKPRLLKEAKDAYHKAIKSEFGTPTTDVDEEYGLDRRVHLAPGVIVKIDADKLDQSTKTGRALARIAQIEDSAAKLCTIRCKLRDMMDTAMVNKFKAFVRSIHEHQPTEAQLRQAVADFRKQNDAHTCPIKSLTRRR